MSDFAKTLGNRLRSYRIRLKLSQEEVAERAELHPTYIGQLERGEKNATLSSVARVAQALDVSLETLFENITTGSAKNAHAAKCYEIVSELPVSEQKAILELIKKTIDYKKM